MLNLDTHILVHALRGALSPREREILAADTWSISGIVLWELSKLNQIGRLELDLKDPEIVRSLARIHTWPLTIAVCAAIQDLDFRSDPADELIAATSMVHRVPLVTRDSTILASQVVPLAT